MSVNIVQQITEIIRGHAQNAVTDLEWSYVDKALEDICRNFDMCDNETKFNIVSGLKEDMLVSFIMCMNSSNHPLVSSVVSGFRTVEKKWTGPEDEWIVGNIMDITRFDITHRLNGFSFDEVILFCIGLTHYFQTYPCTPTIEAGMEWISQIKGYLTQGAFMDSDEHNRGFGFKILDMYNPNLTPDNLIVELVANATNYIRTATSQIITSAYNHNVPDMRKFAKEKFKRELVEVVGNTLAKNLKIALTYDKEKINGNAPNGMASYAFYPLSDILLRAILTGHIMNGDRMAKMKTSEMLWDTVTLRRVINNEQLCKKLGGNIE